MRSLFIRNPNRNVIELDACAGDDPESRMITLGKDIQAYDEHP